MGLEKEKMRESIQKLEDPTPGEGALAAQEMPVEKAENVADAVPALIKALGDPDWTVRRSVVWALGNRKIRGEEAARALILALNDSDERVRLSAVWALGRIGKEAMPALFEALKSPDPHARRNAIFALCEISKKEPQTRQETAKKLNALAVRDPEPIVWTAAYNAIEKMSELRFDETVKTLRAFPKDSSSVKAVPNETAKRTTVLR